MKLFKDFFKDSNGNFSMTRWWTAICYATCTYVIVHNVDKIDWTMLLAYSGVVSGADIAKKVLTKK
jgi:hypothetical protein